MLQSYPEDRYIRVSDINTRYWLAGNRGDCIILIHGLGASAEIWMHNIKTLAEHYRVFIPDLPGFGHSEQPPDSFCPFDYAGFIDGFMAALGIRQASLIGQSLGGGIALQYALKYPQKVDKLILVDCAGFGHEVIWTLRLMSLPWIGELISYPSRMGVSLFFKLAVRNPKVITKEFVDIYYAIFNQPGFQAFLLKITRMLVNFRGAEKEMLAPIMEGLHKIKQPALIIWGENDRVFPIKQAYSGKETMPNAQLHIMNQCGHIPNLEKPDEFNRIVLDFLLGINEDLIA